MERPKKTGKMFSDVSVRHSRASKRETGGDCGKEEKGVISYRCFSFQRVPDCQNADAQGVDGLSDTGRERQQTDRFCVFVSLCSVKNPNLIFKCFRSIRGRKFYRGCAAIEARLRPILYRIAVSLLSHCVSMGSVPDACAHGRFVSLPLSRVIIP